MGIIALAIRMTSPGPALFRQERCGLNGRPFVMLKFRSMETNAELFYYKKQIDSHTPMVIVLLDGEEIEGTIEWYDRGAIKVNRKDAPNLLLLKRNIKYMFKADERVKAVAS